ncbi:MAG: hypothetical protein EBZ13_07485, partial [Planctomycetia bacterium]|nr:hypothetical protein [Planctomycetia bacterium]
YSVLWSDAAGQGSPEFFEAPENPGRVAGAQQPAEAEPISGVAVEAATGVATWRIDLPVNNAAWSYRTSGPGDRPSAELRREGVGSPLPANRPVATVRPGSFQAAVELADIEIVIDERGRLSGIGRFDLTTSRSAVGLRLPEGFRLFELLVDGREVQPAVPGREGPDDVWTITLRPSPWPREIVAVFAGEIGTEVMEGEPVLFEPPMLTGLPTKRVIWTVDHPARLSPRVAGAGWWSVTRRPGRTFAAASRWWPAVVGLGGIAWLLNREPLWPGLVVVAATAVTLGTRWLRGLEEQRRPEISPAEAETIEYRRDGPAGASSVTRTAVGQFSQPVR